MPRAGSSYICVQPHKGQDPETDTAHTYWGVLARKGADGGVDMSNIPFGAPAALPSAGCFQIYADESTVNLVPVMTSNTSPFGVASCSENYGSTPPWCAFVGPGVNGWITNGSALPQWIGYQFPQATVATQYGINPWSADNFPSRTPTAWKLQGSNDGNSWTDLDSQTSFTSWRLNTEQLFTITGNSKAFAYYRLYITANGGNGYTGLHQLRLLGVAALVYSRSASGVVTRF